MSDVRVEIRPTATPEQLYDLHDKMQSEFVNGLWGEGGEQALAHLRDERALPDKAIRQFGLGYVPPGASSVREVIVKTGASLEMAADAGVVKRDSRKAEEAFRRAHGKEPATNEELGNFFLSKCKEDRLYYRDYHCIVPDIEGKGALFGDWIVIPIFVNSGGNIRIGGFQLRSARPKEEIGKQGRYRNPVNSAAMTWNETLIGLAEEEEIMRQTGEAVICEGGFDRYATICALSSRPGPRCAVIALGGIAVRGGGKAGDAEERAGILAKIRAQKTTLLLDQDAKGTEAILTVGPRLAAMGQNVTVARVEDGWDLSSGKELPKDAGELFKAAGAEAVLKALDTGRKRGLMTYAAEAAEATLASRQFGGRAWERLEALDMLIPVLQSIPAPLQGRATARVAAVVGLAEEAVSHLAGRPGRLETPVRQATAQ